MIGLGMFDEISPPVKAHDGVPETREERATIFRRWLHKYDVYIGDYPDNNAIAVTFGGATFVDPVDQFPSEGLFSCLALAIQTGTIIESKRSLTHRINF